MSLNLKFGVSTWLWTSPFRTDTVSLFSRISEMGYDVVEIPVEDPGLIDVGTVKAALREFGLKAEICGAFGTSRDLTHDDPAFHKTSFDYIEAAMEIGYELGATVFAGPMYSAVGKARPVSPEQKKTEWGRAATNLNKVALMAAERGLQLGIEPLNRFESDLINTAEDVVALIKDINHPAAKIMLDGFHMNIEERNIEEAIKLAGDKLVHIQVSENYRGTPGTGQARWEDFKKGLEAIDYQGAICIESFTPEIKELAGLVCIWKPLATSQDAFAKEGLRFLKNWNAENY